jgi:hypothetical protein
MDYVYEIGIGGLTKVYYVPEGGKYEHRQVVADFTDHSLGATAFACFCEALARRGGTLRDFAGKYLVGSLDQLDPPR